MREQTTKGVTGWKSFKLEMCPGDRDAPTVAKFPYSQKVDNEMVL